MVELLEGAGKYRQMLGALLVERENGVQCQVGSGFSDEDLEISRSADFQFALVTTTGVSR